MRRPVIVTAMICPFTLLCGCNLGVSEGDEHGLLGDVAGEHAALDAGGRREGPGFEGTGESRGTVASLTLLANESFAGLLDDLEVAARYDSTLDTFVGRVKNESGAAVCDVLVTVVIDGARIVDTTSLVGLRAGEGQDFTLRGNGAGEFSWTIEIESSTCASAPPASPSGESGEGSGEHGTGGESGRDAESGGESGSEGSAESGGPESGDESSPPVPLSEGFAGVFNNLHFDFAFDASTGAFRGFVENRTGQRVCQSRVEVHIAVGGRVIELGPTIGVDVAPGEVVDVVLSPGRFSPDTYTLHPESSPCP